MRLHSHSLLIHSTAYTYAYIILFIYNSVFADDLFSLMYFMKSLTSRAPWYFLGFFLLPLGAHYMVVISHLLTKFVPLGGERFAVSAPRSVKFNQNVFAVIHDDLVEILSYNYLDSCIIRSWYFFRFDVWFN